MACILPGPLFLGAWDRVQDIGAQCFKNATVLTSDSRQFAIALCLRGLAILHSRLDRPSFPTAALWFVADPVFPNPCPTTARTILSVWHVASVNTVGTPRCL